MPESSDNIIEITGLKNYLGGRWVHDGLDLTVKQGEIIGIIGASGCGKTTLLRTILMLRQATAGEVRVFDIDVANCSEQESMAVRKRWGVMFQSGALFSALTLLENVMFPMKEFTQLSKKMEAEIGLLKIALAGLELEAAYKYPAELSGGMRKRAALARAIAMDPELLFLDEPTAGLDPKSAGELDDLVLELRENLGLTFVMVTHDLDTLWRVPDRVVFMGEGKVLAAEPMATLVQHSHPVIQAYFSGPRTGQRGQLSSGAQHGIEG